jgi:murein L,D-transpeptidase YafK
MSQFIKVYLSIFTCLCFVLPLHAQQNNDVPDGAHAKPIKNFQVISEYSDGKGNIVRVVQYTQGSIRVKETTITPKRLSAGEMKNVDLSKLSPDSLHLVYRKQLKELSVYYKGKLVKAYRAVSGPKPDLDKLMEGDRNTPEGTFKIVSKNGQSKYHRFLLIDYPKPENLKRFEQLKKEGKIPSNAKIGGAIGLHGIWKGGDDMIEMGVNWTDGCIAVKNKDIEELFGVLKIGTKIIIVKN